MKTESIMRLSLALLFLTLAAVIGGLVTLLLQTLSSITLYDQT